MKSKYLLFILSLPLFFPEIISASQDSLGLQLPISTVIRYTNEGYYLDNKPTWTVPDSTLTEVSSVDPSKARNYNSLGTLGSALDARVFTPVKDIFLFAGARSFEPYLLKPEDLKYFRSNKRFTEITYHNSSFKEQEIEVVHSQNIKKYWSAGLDFNRLGVRDYTRNSDTYHNRFALYTWYDSPSKRYELFASVIWNTIKNQLNGGLENDTAYIQGNIDNLGLKGVNIALNEAEQRIRKNIYSLSQKFNTGKFHDSLRTVKSNALQIIHSGRLEKGSYAYSDQEKDSSFYSHFFNNSGSTYDSLHYYNLVNHAGFLIPASDSSSSFFRRNFSFSLEGSHQWLNYRQRDDLYFNNFGTRGRLFTKSDTGYCLNASVQYLIAGEQKGAYSMDLLVSSPEYKAGRIYASAGLIRRSPDLVQLNYYSNHFIWENDFGDTYSQSIVAGLYNKNYAFRLEMSIHNLNNFIFVNQNSLPSQYEGSFSVNQVKVIKNFKYKWLHADNSLLFQQTGQENLMPLPSYSGTHSVYLEKRFFKNALNSQIGFQLNYHSSYYSRAYMPATSEFYLQDAVETGDHLNLDFFVHLKIKSARVFLRINNIGDGLVDDSYYQTPYYPQPGRTLCFGLNWRFYDM